MTKTSSSELILIRHGATDRPGHLCGRTDVGLYEVPYLPMGSDLVDVEGLWVSPARRARETAQGLWPGRTFNEDERLWEQDFGEWDGLAYADVPDVGTLENHQLAELAGPGGESFADLVSRVAPVLVELAAQERTVAVVAHAGVIRAALALATLDVAGALAFEVDHLSVTRLRCLGGTAFSVISVNGVLT